MYLSFTFNSNRTYAQETTLDTSVAATETSDSIALANAKILNQNNLQAKANDTNTLYPPPQSLIGPDFLSLLELIAFAFFSLLTLNRTFKNKKP